MSDSKKGGAPKKGGIAKADWREGRFAKVPEEADFIPLPPDPKPVDDVANLFEVPRYFTRASKSNRTFLDGRLRIEPTADPSRLEFAFDAQTSGGLLIAVAPGHLGRLLEELQSRGAASSAVVGLVTERQGEAAVILR